MRSIKALLAASLVLPISAAVAPSDAVSQALTTPAPAEPIPLSVFARLPQTEGPRISADRIKFMEAVKAFLAKHNPA